MSRDPRIDPRAGDRLEAEWGNFHFCKTVESVSNGRVHSKTVASDPDAVNTTTDNSLEFWRAICIGWSVAFAAPDERDAATQPAKGDQWEIFHAPNRYVRTITDIKDGVVFFSTNGERPCRCPLRDWATHMKDWTFIRPARDIATEPHVGDVVRDECKRLDYHVVDLHPDEVAWMRSDSGTKICLGIWRRPITEWTALVRSIKSELSPASEPPTLEKPPRIGTRVRAKHGPEGVVQGFSENGEYFYLRYDNEMMGTVRIIGWKDYCSVIEPPTLADTMHRIADIAGPIDEAAVMEAHGIEPTYESVEHPPHYGGDNPHEAIKFIEAHKLDFNAGNVVKYLVRAGRKPGEEAAKDIAKAVWYLNRFAESQKGAAK